MQKKEFLAHQLNCSLVISPTWLYFFLKRLYKQNTNYQHHRLAKNSINTLMDIVVIVCSTYFAIWGADNKRNQRGTTR